MNDQSQLYFEFLVDSEHSYAEVYGGITNILYENPYTGWKVVDVRTDKNNKILKLSGYLPNIQNADKIHAKCTITTHPIFGECLQIDEFYKELPYQKEGIIKFMIAMVDGVGEHIAENIVAKFKDNTLAILEEQPERLLEIEGINHKLIDKIKNSTEKINSAVKELILIGFSPKWASRIYMRYGKDAAHKVTNHPYRLIRDFNGIGFKKAEIIAQKIGIDALNEERINAAIFYSHKSTLEKTGHNFLYLEDLKETVSKLLKLPRAYIESEILSTPNLVIEDSRVYLPQHYNAENTIAEKICEKIKLDKKEISNFNENIISIENEIDIEFSEEQKEAIKASTTNPLTIITGAAGTGKTTICCGLIKLLDILGSTYSVCAPTGKAANKLEAVTGKKASTIHRLLKYAPSAGYRINENNPLNIDYLIVDEASMVDLLLLKAIFLGAGKKTRMIFIGDPHQIPPVAVGNSLQALEGSYAVSQVVLPRIFRQKKESTILKNANLVNIEKLFPMEDTEDFKFIDVSNPIKMIKLLHDSIEELKKEGYHPIKDINILTPLNKGGGEISVSNLNARLRDSLNPATGTNSFKIYEREFRINDKVMQGKNDYELDIYNGDIGFLTANDPIAKYITIDFYGNEINIPYPKTENISHNYAMTVHKAQGSEAKAIIFLATKAGCYFLLNKNLFYTAITRAKEKLIMIMPYSVVRMAVGFNIRRQSHLSKRIQNLALGHKNNNSE